MGAVYRLLLARAKFRGIIFLAVSSEWLPCVTRVLSRVLWSSSQAAIISTDCRTEPTAPSPEYDLNDSSVTEDDGTVLAEKKSGAKGS